MGQWRTALFVSRARWASSEVKNQQVGPHLYVCTACATRCNLHLSWMGSTQANRVCAFSHFSMLELVNVLPCAQHPVAVALTDVLHTSTRSSAFKLVYTKAAGYFSISCSLNNAWTRLSHLPLHGAVPTEDGLPALSSASIGRCVVPSKAPQGTPLSPAASNSPKPDAPERNCLRDPAGHVPVAASWPAPPPRCVCNSATSRGTRGRQLAYKARPPGPGMAGWDLPPSCRSAPAGVGG